MINASRDSDDLTLPDGPSQIRIDKWLFFSRMVKSRSLAAKLVMSGHVRINGVKADQPSKSVKPGDTLTVTKDHRVIVATIRSCGTRRGPAPEAQLLYIDKSPPPPEKDVSALDRISGQRDMGAGRPTKKERRQTDRLRGL